MSFHKDIKPTPFLKGKNPNVYTIILYLDDAGIYVGNKKIVTKPGDIVIFNAFNLHKAIGIDPFSKTKQRRVLQLFECFFDEKEKNDFMKRVRFCYHKFSSKFIAFAYYFIDPRWFLEYLNLVSLNTIGGCDKDLHKDFVIIMKKSEPISNIDGVKYYAEI
jgi:hypothetical protein